MAEITLEICTFNATDVALAIAGGADRIELCASYVEGGITPSHAAILSAFELVSAEKIVVMIRPRGGDFIYDDYEFEVMKQDIIHCKRIGVKQVIFGIITEEGKLDAVRNKMLVDLASPMQCILQRAFDLTDDPFEALQTAIDCGFKRILTSGQKPSVHEGMKLVKQLIEVAENKITILPGAGVNSTNAKEIISYTGCNEIHTSAKMKAPVKQSPTFKFREGIYDYSHLTCVNKNEVAALKAITLSF